MISNRNLSIQRSSWLALGALFFLFFSAVAFTYLWVGPAPLWAWMTACAAALVVAVREFRMMAFATIREMRGRIILPWLLYVLIIFSRDLFGGTLAESITDRVALNLFCLMLAVVLAVLVRVCFWQHVLMILAIICGLQGALAIAQYQGNAAAWDLPMAISAYSSRDAAWDQMELERLSAADVQAGFDRVGRARGFDVYVHKFSAYQGVLVGLVAGAMLGLGNPFGRPWWRRLTLAAGALLGVVSVVVTFSRAPIIGLASGLGFAALLAARKNRLVPLLLFPLTLVVVSIAVLALNLSEAREFSRLFSFDLGSTYDAGRFATWVYSWRLFVDSPLIGAGSAGMDGASLVTHNVPLRVLGDFGLLGFMFYAWIWLSAWRIAWTNTKYSEPAAYVVALGALSAFTVAMIDNTTHSSGLLQRDVSQPALLGIIIGLCLATRTAPASRFVPRPPSPGLKRPVKSQS